MCRAASASGSNSAIYAGYRIPPYYDSLIGKLIVFGKTRTECLMRLQRALGEYVIEGVETTIPLFQRLLPTPTSSMATTIFTGWSIFSPANNLAPMTTITPQILLQAYAAGIFPMAESAEDNALYWVEPEVRGILPLDQLHVSHSLRKTIRRATYEIRIDTAFGEVIDGCATKTPGRTNDLDQLAASARSTRSSTRWAAATRSRPGRTACWSADSTA